MGNKGAEAIAKTSRPTPERLWSYEEYGELLRSAPSVRGVADVPLFRMLASKDGKTWLVDDRMSLLQVRVLRPILRNRDYDVTVELLF